MKNKMFVLTLMTLFILSACGGDKGGEGNGSSSESTSSSSSSSVSIHEHTYSSSWSSDDTYHWHVATCGHDITSGKEKHNFSAETVDPTFDDKGYTTHTCTICGYSYNDSYTDKLTHTYSAGWSYDAAAHWHVCTDEGYEHLRKDVSAHEFKDTVVEPTYESGGYTLHECECGYSYKDSYIDKLVRTYTITWENWDGTVLDTDTVNEGDTPKYDDGTPTRPEDGIYTYTFKGWSPDVAVATSNQTYTATYTNEKIKYVISFDLNGGSSSEYEGSKTVEEFDRSVFFFDLEKEGANFRGWSYNGERIFDETGKQYSTPKMEREMLFVAIFSETVKMSITTNMPEAGTISDDGEYEFNTYVDVSARPYQGYKFVGWYYQGTLLSNTEDYRYMMWEDDVTIEARFALDSFKMSIQSNDETYGLVLLKSDEYREYCSSYSESREYTSKVTVAAYSKTDVRFLGWYDEDNSLVSTSAVYSFSMPNHDYSLEAKWNHFKIEYNLNGGTNSESNPSEYTIDDADIQLHAPEKTGYAFIGWKLEGEYVTTIDPSLMHDLTLDAIWEATVFSITYNLNGGDNSGDNPMTYTIESGEITLVSPTKDGYFFEGWYLDLVFIEKIIKIPSGSYGDLNLYARWEAITYSITYDLNGGTISSTNPLTYTVEDEIELASPQRDGYTFAGWYNGETNMTTIPKGTFGDLSLKAKWSSNLNSLTVMSEDETKGTVTVLFGNGYTGEEITIKATPADGCSFAGWYDGETKVGSSYEYTFSMPAGGKTLVARFVDEGEYLGKTPVFDSETKTVTYGLYPQTHVNDEALISSLNELITAESNGWYFYDGSYYAKRSAKPYGSSYTFSDDTKIVWGTEYWFRCEPIEWKILSSSDGMYSLASSVLLDAHRYNEYYTGTDEDGHYANDYGNSEIRSWLNGEFYSSAFALDGSLIQTVTVDNSAASTGSSYNQYACSDTEDKVYLLSYQDYMNADYFPGEASRSCKNTDWAKANYGICNSRGSYDGNGWYWTRSPHIFDSYRTWRLYEDGSISGDDVSSAYICVRPAITIKVV